MRAKLLLLAALLFCASPALAQQGGGGGGGGVSATVNVADPATPSQKAAVNASGQLSITCANCSGSGASAVDESVFTQGTNSLAPAGGLFITSYTALTTGHVGISQMTSDGALFMNLHKVGGTAITLGQKASTASLPVVFASDQSALSVTATGNIASGSSDSGNPLKIGGVFNTTQPTFTTGQRGDLQLTARGGVIVSTGTDIFHITCDSGCTGTGGTSISDNGVFTQSTTTETPISGLFTSAYTAATAGHSTVWQMTSDGNGFVNIAKIAGTAWATAASGIPKVGITDAAGTGVTLNADGGLPIHVQNGSTTVTEASTITQNQASSALTAAVMYGNNGTADARIVAKGSTPASGDVGMVTRPLMPSDGTNTMPTMDAAARAGYMRPTDGTNFMPMGDAAARAIIVKPPVATAVVASALSNSATQVVNAAGTLDSYYCYNPNASVVFVQFFNTSTPTVGTTGPVWSIGIPATQGANLSNVNLSFSTAIYVAATTTVTGGTAPGTALNCNFGYR